MKKTSEIWNEHYSRLKSRLSYPDENLVRILSRLEGNGKVALDFGAGSGRHSVLLKSFGYKVTALDYTENSLKLISELDPEIETKLVGELPYPFKDESIDILITWGVLHYNSPEIIKKMITEYRRILKKDGFLVGTMRADRDTYLGAVNSKASIPDLQGAEVHLFSLSQLNELLSEFSEVKVGYMERTPIGKLDERISHWIFQCKK